MKNPDSPGHPRTRYALRVPLLVLAGLLLVPLLVLGAYHSSAVLTTPESLLAECNDEGALIREGGTIVSDHPGPAGADASVTARGCAYLHVGLGDWSACRNLPVERPGVPCRKGLWTVTFEDRSVGDAEDASSRTTFTYGL